MKRIFQIQKLSDQIWSTVSQCYCEKDDVRGLIHTVSTDPYTRVKAATQLVQNIDVYNFCPPGVMTKL